VIGKPTESPSAISRANFPPWQIRPTYIRRHTREDYKISNRSRSILHVHIDLRGNPAAQILPVQKTGTTEASLDLRELPFTGKLLKKYQHLDAVFDNNEILKWLKLS
jgi:hypothetical protein